MVIFLKNIIKILFLSSCILFLSSFNTSSDDGIKNVIKEVFELERLSKLGNQVPSAENLSNNKGIQNELDSKNKFYKLWREKLQNEVTDINQELIFDKIEKTNDYYKVFLTRNLEQKSLYFESITQKSYNEKYIALISLRDNKYLVETIVFQEENPDGYEDLVKFTGEYRDINTSNYLNSWSEKLNSIDILYKDFKSIINEDNSSINYRTADRYFDSSLSSAYAQKYALNYNSEYKDFTDSGGDCTNFVSQCLAAGGLRKTYTWKPYTASWYSVQYLRNYLINNNLAKEYPNISPNPIGSMIQFFNPQKNYWAHSGIITYVTKNDCLYCCHTYNKLNYPLSGVYPTIYHKIRVLEIN